jgi:Pregnancy-associated plasma protein-A
MHRLCKRLVLAAVVATAAVGAATASPAAAHTMGASTVLPCAMSASGPFAVDLAVPADGARAGDREPAAWKNPPIEEAPATGHGHGFKATIPVYFHVFTDGTKGYLSTSQLKQQVSVLNAGFGGFEGGVATGFSFKYAGADYTDNADWFYNMTFGTSLERQAKPATHVGDARTLNIWTTNGPGYLGYAEFPSWYKRTPELDGVVLDYNSFLGGAYGSAFSLGKTATHEVGHWLGLLHTFQGGCNAKGDYVDDTPAMLVPTSACPEGKDTCPEPGTDPIHNYMDYSYDSCYTQFTQGQANRMQDMYTAFRADGGHAVGQ